MACWSCERPEGQGPLCDKCGAILPPRADRSHFDVLGVEPRFDLDAGQLEKNFKDLSRKVHPDRFARADPKARRFALAQTTAINDAYRLLRDPLRRAEYLLKLGGIDLEKAKVEQPFLVEMLELQEALGDAKAQGDSPRVAQMTTDIQARRDHDWQGVRDDFAGAKPDALDSIAKRLVRIRYFNRALGVEHEDDAADAFARVVHA